MALARAIRQPGDRINGNPRNSGALSEPSRARPSKGSQIRSSSRLRIQRMSTHDQQVRVGPTRIQSWASLHRHRLNASWPSRAQRGSSGGPELTNWGVPIVRCGSQTPGRARQPTVGAARHGGGAARRSSDLDQHMAQGGRGTHWGYRSRNRQGQKKSRSPAPEPLKLSSCCARDSALTRPLAPKLGRIIPRANQLLTRKWRDGRSPAAQRSQAQS